MLGFLAHHIRCRGLRIPANNIKKHEKIQRTYVDREGERKDGKAMTGKRWEKAKQQARDELRLEGYL